jgi:predicted nucleotidyltransferase
MHRVAGAVALLVVSAAAQPQFTDVTAAAGIDFDHTFGGLEKHHILEAHGSGAAFFDYDNDGDLDLYVVNGATFSTYEAKSGPGNAHYRNRGDGAFDNVSHDAGTGDAGWGAGVAVGDIDNDGHRDLYVTNYGPNVLYRNLGAGAFGDITPSAGVGGRDFSASAAFLDYDNDGDVDLYVANYVVFDAAKAVSEESRPCTFYGGIDVYCGPKGLVGAPDVLYRNDGDLAFTDVTESSGIARANRFYGLGVMPLDYDGDGDIDICVANDETPNVLFRNDGDGAFTDVALLAGVAYNGDGDVEAGMGIHAADVDNDGDDDLYLTHFFSETNTLYRNEGQRRQSGAGMMAPVRFTDVTSMAGLAAPTVGLLGWGTRFFDWDHDGLLDLFVANGHVYPQVDRKVTGSPYRQPDQLFRNIGDGTFQEISKEAGLGGLAAKVSRGAAFGDIDNDGDIDVFVSNLNDTPTLLRHDGDSRRNWLMVQVVGTRSNRDAVGTRLRLVAAGRSQWRTISGAGSYLSASDIRAHFGLGKIPRVEKVEVTWPDGTTRTVVDLPANRLLVIRQGGDYEIVDFSDAPSP